MDSAAAEADVKLYKASSELLAELQAKIPFLLSSRDSKTRRWVLYTKTAEIARLLDSFQEWPQLLDTSLADLVQTLVAAFLEYCINSPQTYLQSASIQATYVEQLPRAVCRLLYVFCKVRGYKIIVRLLNNEPKYIEPLLACFREWNQTRSSGQVGMSWEERYIVLLWLSHLMLAPFELRTISGFTSTSSRLPDSLQLENLPGVASVLLDVGLEHLCVASKDREAASWLIVRLALRKDMQQLRMPGAIIQWCTSRLISNGEEPSTDQYHHVGLLTLLHRLTDSSSSTEVAPFLRHIFDTCKTLTTDSSAGAVSARQSAPSRKLLIKIIRASILHALALANSGSDDAVEDLDVMLEDTIGVLLEWLADSDTPVRQSASKALGMIILKLDAEMAAEVIEAILGCLNENMLLENRRTGQLTAATDFVDVDMNLYKKNVNAVDALKWHGAMLALGHVLFRRSPPPEQLPSLLEALLMGLAFEQRSNVGTSLGVGVRDAACFGIWSLARKYTTAEIDAACLSPSALLRQTANIGETSSTLQTIATNLVVASCLDPSGNLRRGASAALQELIGRHPDTIHEGIAVVQRVDYHAVARRSRAMTEVSQAVAELGDVYHRGLLQSLLDWRGCRAVDSASRRQAAETVGILYARSTQSVQAAFTKEVLAQVMDLKDANVGSNAATRHGLLLCVAHMIRANQDGSEVTSEVTGSLLLLLKDIDATTGALNGRVTADLTRVLEGTAELINAATSLENPQLSNQLSSVAQHLEIVLDRCTIATEDDVISAAAAQANAAMFKLLKIEAKTSLLEAWLPTDFPQQRSSHTCKGRIESMSLLLPLLTSDPELVQYQQRIVTFLSTTVSSGLSIETKVNAMQGITSIVQASTAAMPPWMQSLAEAISVGLADYTVDQRGDIGSLLRLASVEAVQKFDHATLDEDMQRQLLKLTVQLAADKLIKVRFAAWSCIQSSWASQPSSLGTLRSFHHQADVSSFEYYQQLTGILKIDWLHDCLLQGLVGSIAGGADDISQTASSAVICFLDARSQEEQLPYLRKMVMFLLQHLHILAKHDDREVVPLLDCLCLLREQFSAETEIIFKDERATVIGLVDDLQVPIADIPRIQALIRLLSGLSSMPGFELDAKDKISRKLLHKWPKARHAAADAVFLLDTDCIPAEVDWNQPPLKNKDKVVKLRRDLGVSGHKAASKA